MKNLIFSLAAGTLLLCSATSCKKNDASNSTSTSFSVSSSNRQLILPNDEFKSTTTISNYNFVNEVRGEVESKELDKGNIVKDFTVNRLWLSEAKIQDFSHVDIDENIDDLNNYLTSFKVYAQDNNLNDDLRLLAEGNSTGNLTIVDTDFYAYTLSYPDFSLILKSEFNADPGSRSILINASVGISYEYTTAERKE